ncbi:hypothetical protein Glove_319g155 [Diversispora epigaea]|uniref:Uncharacterized protein n=1 Tax=Diversispora epigaea TaxID=1348612 RepID=A0A397HSU4_9GLOM|nr:hypothetical protein Glove_319g155 [Diversispora epigaea]
MIDPEYGSIVSLLQDYFKVANRPPIKVSGDECNSELIAADFSIFPNKNYVHQLHIPYFDILTACIEPDLPQFAINIPVAEVVGDSPIPPVATYAYIPFKTIDRRERYVCKIERDTELNAKIPKLEHEELKKRDLQNEGSLYQKITNVSEFQIFFIITNNFTMPCNLLMTTPTKIVLNPHLKISTQKLQNWTTDGMTK